MSRSRFWPLPLSYFIAYGLFFVANALMAVAKAGGHETPALFRGIWPVVIIIGYLCLEFFDMFAGGGSQTDSQY